MFSLSYTDVSVLSGIVGRLQVGKYADTHSISDSDSGSAGGSVYSDDSPRCEPESPFPQGLPRRAIQQPARRHGQFILSLPTISLVSSEAETKIGGKLTWREWGRAPQMLFSLTNAVTIHNNMLYISDVQTIFAYDASRSTNSWSKLPDCPYSDSSLAVVNNLLTTIGGGATTIDGVALTTNKVFSFTGEGKSKSWIEKFPPMPTKRWWTAALCTGISLIAAGGVGEINCYLTTVEVMNTETHQWSTAADLPRPVAPYTSSTLCGDQFFIPNGRTIYICPLTALLQSCTSPSSHLKSESSSYIKPSVQWNKVADLQVVNFTCVSLNGQLLAIGGVDNGRKYSTAVYLYNAATNSWTVISHMSTARSSCIAAVLPDNKLVVVGGCSTDFRSVEIATLT